MELWRRREAQVPLLIDIPHAGTHVPPALQARFTEAARTLPDTDWHVDKLFSFAGEMGAGLLAATHSRYVIDLNRDPGGLELYPGFDNTELVPLSRFDRELIYRPGQFPDAAEIAERVRAYWRPYHERLRNDIEGILARFGHCILLDGHSIPAQVPRFFSGRLPDLNLGTSGGNSASPSIASAAWSVLENQPRFSRVQDGRFKGGFITRYYGKPERNVHALQIEIVQDCYMDEENPQGFDEGRAAALTGVLKSLVQTLIDAPLPSRSCP